MIKARWERTHILDQPVDLVRREDVLSALPALVRSGIPHHFVALNPIKVMRAQREPPLRALLARATCVFPDAVGVTWALRVLHRRRLPVLPGCELMLDMLAQASRERYRVFLVGAQPDVVSSMSRKLAEEHPGIELAGAQHGYFPDAEQDEIARRVVAAGPDLVFVGMGAQRQESFVRAVEEAGGESVMMTVGGSFDAYIGAVPRPPRWLRRMHLEWLYRLLKQPFRAPRMLDLPRFACRVLRLRYAPSARR